MLLLAANKWGVAFAILFLLGLVWHWNTTEYSELRQIFKICPSHDEVASSKNHHSELQMNINKIFKKIEQSLPNITITSTWTSSSSGKHSKGFIINPKDKYCVGDVLTVQYDMYDHLGKRKKYGGDFLRPRIFTPELQAGASGKVEDFKNGSYHLHFILSWEGRVKISTLLFHPSEGIAALWRSRHASLGVVGFQGRYKNATNEAITQCGFKFENESEVCEYIDDRDEEAFYCVKPSNLPCDSLNDMRAVLLPTSYLSSEEKLLFQRSNIAVEMSKDFEYVDVLKCDIGWLTNALFAASPGLEPRASLSANECVTCNSTDKLLALGINGEVFPAIRERHDNPKDAIYMYRKKVATKCSTTLTTQNEKCKTGMNSPFPSGYFLNNKWHPLFCNMVEYKHADNFNTCLQGKKLFLIGDSTLRQYIMYFTESIKIVKYYGHHETGWNGWEKTLLAINLDKDILVSYKRHGFPLENIGFYLFKEDKYTSRQIDDQGGGSNTIIAITMGQHFRQFPLQLYIRRALNIRKAIERLLIRSPDTKVIIKAENTRDTNTAVERLSDFHGYCQYLVMREVFKDLNVGFVDAFDMSYALATENVHPQLHVLENIMSLTFTYAC